MFLILKKGIYVFFSAVSKVVSVGDENCVRFLKHESF